MTNPHPVPISSPQVGGFSFEEFLLLSDQNDFEKSLCCIDWSGGKTKHNQMATAFRSAAQCGISKRLALDLVAEKVRDSGGVLCHRDLLRQCDRAYDYVQNGGVGSGTSTGFFPCLPPPKFNRKKALKQARKVDPVSPEDLAACSPMPVAGVSSYDFLEALYDPGESVIVCPQNRSKGDVFQIGDRVRPLPSGGIDGVMFLSNPVDGLMHPNPREEGKLSRRSQESVTSWRYLVLESDEVDEAVWLRIVVQLPLKICALYRSGRVSVHGLVRVDATSKDHWDKIRDEMKPGLVALGACPGSLTAVRLTRLPGAFRRGVEQKLLYLDPGADGTPIISKLTQ